MKFFRKMGKVVLAYVLLTQFTGAATGAFIAVYYGPEAEAMIMEVVEYVAY